MNVIQLSRTFMQCVPTPYQCLHSHKWETYGFGTRPPYSRKTLLPRKLGNLGGGQPQAGAYVLGDDTTRTDITDESIDP